MLGMSASWVGLGAALPYIDVSMLCGCLRLGAKGGRARAHFVLFVFWNITRLTLSPQYLILGTLVVTCFVQYLLHVFERRRAAPWTEKPLYAALIDLGLGTSTPYLRSF
jgi:hypothetical protein